MSAHTPAPWAVFPKEQELCEDGMVCEGGYYDVRPSGGQRVSNDDLADMTLISASPDMLDALRDVVRRLALHVQQGRAVAADQAALDKAVAAITKATVAPW